jgi:hypothetical protein
MIENLQRYEILVKHQVNHFHELSLYEQIKSIVLDFYYLSPKGEHASTWEPLSIIYENGEFPNVIAKNGDCIIFKVDNLYFLAYLDKHLGDRYASLVINNGEGIVNENGEMLEYKLTPLFKNKFKTSKGGIFSRYFDMAENG